MLDQHEQVVTKAGHKIKAALQENNNDQYLLGLMLDDIEQIKRTMNRFKCQANGHALR